MTSTAEALQDAILGAVITALAAAGKTCPVFDHTPKKASYPFVALGGINRKRSRTSTGRHDRRFITLSLFSALRGTLEIQALTEVIVDALDEAKLDLSAGRLIRLSVDGTSSREDGGGTYMGRVDLIALTEEI